MALAVAQLLCSFRLALCGAGGGGNAALLPQPELRRQVGVRWPVAGQPCWVQATPLSRVGKLAGERGPAPGHSSGEESPHGMGPEQGFTCSGPQW